MRNDIDQVGKVISQFTSQSILFHSSEYSLSSNEYIQWAIERMPLCKNDHVLDVAAGTGLMSLAVSPYVQSVVAVDITEAMLKEGRKDADRRGISNVTFRCADACHLGDSQSYDIAMSRLAFHHFCDPEAVFRQMIRAVIKGGAVVVCDLLSPDNPELSLIYNRLERMRDDSHTTALTSKELAALFEQFGLKNIKTYFRHVINDLEAWMKMTATPEDNRNIIRRAIFDEIRGGETTGFSPFVDDSGSIKFAHSWMMIIGTKQ